MEKGDLKQNGVHLLEHEWNTVKFLLEKAIKEIENHFTLSKRIIRIKIITKDRKILDYLK